MEIYNFLGKALGFLVLVIFLQMYVSDKTAVQFLSLVLFSMLILNTNKIFKGGKK